MANATTPPAKVQDAQLEVLLDHLKNLSLINTKPRRVIKLNIFPETYDKTIIPPLENGNILQNKPIKI